jgi:Ribbon-helix-helix protein, copG family
MATNLRLRPDAQEALRVEAVRTGRSQQELIREAVDRYLGLTQPAPARSESERLIAAGVVLPARTGYRDTDEPLALPAGTSSLDLLDRRDRL